MALALGKTVGELSSSLSSRELMEWMAFDSMEPIGDRRGDLQNAMLMCLLANINRDPKKSPYRVSDFIPTYEPRKPQTPEYMLQIIKQYSAVVGGLKNARDR